MNLRWPATVDNHLSPWFVILWRVTLAPLVLLLMLLLAGVITLGWGRQEAGRVWYSIR